VSTNERFTDSGIEIKTVYRGADLKDFDEKTQLGEPGAYPYTRGVQETMYRGKLWTMRQYAGFGTAEATNERFKFLLVPARRDSRARSTSPRRWASTLITYGPKVKSAK